MSPDQLFHKGKSKIKPGWKLAFFSAVLIGLLIHMPVMLADVPNHDGLANMYSDLNVIVSGRWFLTVACGFSSFYTIPWLIGLLGLFFLGLTAAVLVEFLEVKKGWAVVAVSGLLVSFPALASTFAYVFTLDGYMLAMFLAALAALLTKKYRKGYLAGAVCLALSLGTYQAYLPFAVILALFGILEAFAGGKPLWEKWKITFRYAAMGVLGVLAYYGILRILLWIQGKELVSYQGIDQMALTGQSVSGMGARIAGIYRDFAAFTLKGRVLFHNPVSGLAAGLLVLSAVFAALCLIRRKKLWKNPVFFVIMVAVMALLPVAANVILLVTPDVTYHLLMRYQWVLFLIGLTAFVSRQTPEKGPAAAAEWIGFAAALTLVFFYGVTDNIGYNNLMKRYEKTYAYCVRLVDRIEQTPGYYQGIPIAMIGVVGDDPYPSTDITLSVTENMIGLGGQAGDVLLYTGANYEQFIRYYLGVTLNILPPEAMSEMYYSQEYREMDSFPGENSMRVIDGVLYIKTENKE